MAKEMKKQANSLRREAKQKVIKHDLDKEKLPLPAAIPELIEKETKVIFKGIKEEQGRKKSFLKNSMKREEKRAHYKES